MLYKEELQLDLEKSDGSVKIITHDKVAKAIDRLQYFEPPEGYYLAFSGGKDSQCIYHLAKEAGVKFDAHYSLTTVDPPELIYFIRENYPDVIIDKPKKSMWELIVDKGTPPTRVKRFCCSELKEGDGKGRIVVTGVRWAESVNRKNNRQTMEIMTAKKKDSILYSDNSDNRRLFETCIKKGKRIINPIVDWSTADVWEYIKSRQLKYCSLYDEGHKRIGCIGCPMNTKAAKDLERYPKYKAAYLRSFERMIEKHNYKIRSCLWHTPERVMQWWLEVNKRQRTIEGQLELEE